MKDFQYEVFTNVLHVDLASIAELRAWLNENIGQGYINWMTFSSARNSDHLMPVKVVQVDKPEHVTLIKMRWS